MSDNENSVPTVYSDIKYSRIPKDQGEIPITTSSFFKSFSGSGRSRTILKSIMFSNHSRYDSLKVGAITPLLEKALPFLVRPFSAILILPFLLINRRAAF